MRVILMHGKDTDPSGKWYPWFAEEIQTLGYEYAAPVLPNAADPVLDEWVAELEKLKPDEDTVLVGHSRGGVAILRWLERQPPGKKVKKVILVATNSGLLSKRAIPDESNYGFYTEEGYDFEKVKAHCDEFVVLHSRDDNWVPFEAGEENAEGLDAEFLRFDSYGHFGRGVDEIPELLEGVVDFDHRKALLVPINSRGEIVLQDRDGHNPPPWGFFGGEIEEGESPLEAVIRESKEELELDIAEDELRYVGVRSMFFRGEKRILRHFFLYSTEQREFTVHEGRAAVWVSFEEAAKRLENSGQLQKIEKMAKIQK